MQNNSTAIKVALIPALFITGLCGVVLYVTAASEAQHRFGALVNVAGRQRMLNQRWLAEMHAIPLGHRVDVGATEELLRTTAKTLLDGGTISIGNERIEVSAATDPELRALLSEQARLIDQLGSETSAWIASGGTEPVEAIRALIAKNHDACDGATLRLQKHSEDAARAIGLRIGWASILVSLVGGGISLLVVHRVRASIVETLRVIESMGNGDMTERVDVRGHDDFALMGESLNTALDLIEEVLVQVTTSAETARASSEQLGAASKQLANGTQIQAASLEETASAVNDASTQAKANASHSMKANELAQSSFDTARHGGSVVNDAVESMREISDSSKEIEAIITTIDEIAFQTNLLALNAAVEAARAGESGRGFAVVASEVRNLAQRSADAAKQINGLIKDSIERIDNGTKRVTESGTVLQKMVESVNAVTNVVAQISDASAEQANGLVELSKAIKEMDDVTHSTVNQTRGLTDTAFTLAEEAETMQNLVARFRIRLRG